MPECNLILAGMNDINITSNSIFIVVYFAWVGINLVDLKECGRGFRFSPACLSGSHFGYLGPMLLF